MVISNHAVIAVIATYNYIAIGTLSITGLHDDGHYLAVMML